MPTAVINKKTEYKKRFNSLKAIYLQWQASHQSLATYLNPSRGQFTISDNRGAMINHQIVLDAHATNDIKILASGLQSGMTSPSRPWFRLTLSDKKKEISKRAREWLDDVGTKMLNVCSNSNVYDSFYTIYEELGTFGTACAIILEDYDCVVRMRTFTAGEYYIGTDERGIVNSFAREFKMKVGQVVKWFGYDNCSAQVKGFYDTNLVDQYVTIYHLIEENDERNLSFDNNKNMKYRSAYWESGDEDTFLSITGYEEFPIIAPRWDLVTSNQDYGYGPGWYALGDVKQLQKTVLDKLLMQEKLHNPPMQEDANIVGNSNYLPGGKTKVTNSVQNSGVKPSYQISDSLQSFIESINVLKGQIDKWFYTNIFLMMANFDKTQMTATEVAQREQENIMMMGPILNRIHREMLVAFLERLFAIMMRADLFDVAPEEMQGEDIKIEFISVLAQAQRAIGAVSIDRVVNRVASMMQMKQDIIDNIDMDAIVREFSDMEAIPARLLTDKAQMQQVREQRAQQQTIQRNLEGANVMADAAKKASQAKLTDDNMLSKLAKSIKK